MESSEERLRADLENAPFRGGVILGWWRIVDLAWPFLTLAVRAASRPIGPPEYILRVECNGYRATAPLGTFWDVDRNAPLDVSRRPLRKDPHVDESFKNFPGLYTAFDRAGLNAHPAWKDAMPAHAWHPWSTIADYAREIYGLLNSPRYLGANVA